MVFDLLDNCCLCSSQALYNEYVHFKETEIPEKEVEKALIKHLYKLLEVSGEHGRGFAVNYGADNVINPMTVSLYSHSAEFDL